MATSVLPPQQHSQSSRKGKKAWRKNVDVTELQAGLEAARDEIIQHGAIIAEQPSDALFAIEPKGSVAIQRAYLKENKPLKADEILAQRSAIPSLDQRKRKAEKTTDGVLPAKKRKAGISHKELERLRGIAYGGDAVHKDVVRADGMPSEDLWAVEAPKAADDTEDQFSFLEKKKPIRAPPTITHAPISLLANGKTLPAVPKPLGGRSYNPDFDDWADLIEHYGEAEVTKERKRLGDAAAAAELAERIARSAEIATLAEQEDDDASAWESEWEGFVSEREDADASAEWLSKKRPERKTKAERNKILKRKEEERRKRHEAQLEAREKQLSEIKKLAAENKARSNTRALTVQQDLDSSDDEYAADALRRRALGKLKVPEAPLELLLADELQDSLRSLRPEGNLLQDRFRGMQLRGKIEARKPITQPKKARRKATEKWSYKDWKLKY